MEIKNIAFSKIWIISILAVVLAGGVFAWQYFGAPKDEIKAPGKKVSEEVIYSKERLPHFEEFPVLEIFEGSPAAVDLSSHPEAPRFKTVLTGGVKEGPNFAGHYTVVTWGCGTECQVSAVIDAKTGFVYFVPFPTWAGAEFRLDSNLFIANPPEVIEKYQAAGRPIGEWMFTHYYKWENNQFILVYSTKTADWKTYRNEEHGFEIKYPKDWAAIESASPEHPYLVFVTLGTQKTIQQGGLFWLTLRDQTEDEYFSSLTQEGFYVITQTHTILGGKKATIYTFGRTDSPGIQWKLLIAQKDDFLIEFSKGATLGYEEFFNQILSTFRFLPPRQ